MTNIMPLIPVEGSAFEKRPLVSQQEVAEMRQQCGMHLKQMLHCRQCRADAIGTLDEDLSMQYYGEQKDGPDGRSDGPTLKFGGDKMAVG